MRPRSASGQSRDAVGRQLVWAVLGGMLVAGSLAAVAFYMRALRREPAALREEAAEPLAGLAREAVAAQDERAGREVQFKTAALATLDRFIHAQGWSQAAGLVRMRDSEKATLAGYLTEEVRAKYHQCTATISETRRVPFAAPPRFTALGTATHADGATFSFLLEGDDRTCLVRGDALIQQVAGSLALFTQSPGAPPGQFFARLRLPADRTGEIQSHFLVMVDSPLGGADAMSPVAVEVESTPALGNLRSLLEKKSPRQAAVQLAWPAAAGTAGARPRLVQVLEDPWGLSPSTVAAQ